MLTNIICNSMDASNPSKEPVMTIKLFSFTSEIQMLNNVLGATRLVCQTPLFFHYNFGNA